MKLSKKVMMTAEQDFALSKFENTEDQGLDYWLNLKKEDVPQVSQEEQIKTSEQQTKIEKLYPSFIKKEIPLEKLIPADKTWNFFPAQNNGVLEDLMKNIVAYGQLSPAIVWQQKDGNYMILGGHTRYEALTRLKHIFSHDEDEEQRHRFDTMDCNVYTYEELDEIEARKIIIFDNIIRRENTTSIKARSIITMAQLENETRTEKKRGVRRTRALENVANALGESASSVKRLYKLRSLIPEFWSLVDARGQEEKITNQLALTISFLPPTLQKYIFDNKLYVNAKLTPSQISMLKTADNIEQLKEIFSMPEKYSFTSKIELNEQIPQNYKPITIFCSEDEMSKIKNIIEWNVCAEGSVSEQTKDLLRKLFSMN